MKLFVKVNGAEQQRHKALQATEEMTLNHTTVLSSNMFFNHKNFYVNKQREYV